MQLDLGLIAELVGGRVIGDPDLKVSGIGSLDDAVEGQITFLANPKLAGKVATTKASAVILPPGANGFGKNVVETGNPYLAFAKLLRHFTHVPHPVMGVMEGAVVGKDVRLGADVTIYPGAYIGEGAVIGDRTIIHPNVVIYSGVTIGDDVVLHSNVSIREGCRLGNRVIVHNGAVIGSDGFGFVPDGRSYFKIPQIGIVVIEDDVEIGANTTIDRAALDVTLIRRGVKLDNLVQVAHNCTVDEDTVIAAQAGIAGSSRVGRHVTAGGQVAIADHVKIGDNIMLAGRTGVISDLDQPGVFSGTPAQPHKEWLKSVAALHKLPELRKTIKELEGRLAMLEKAGKQ
jgi:UDP-3-O-[3-hydroxymyristoyl] glucosamine N-acyltransferase